jgi:hypothetical protein
MDGSTRSSRKIRPIHDGSKTYAEIAFATLLYAGGPRASVIYITVRSYFLWICFGEVMGNAISDQLVTLARGFDEALAIDYCDLASTALNQTCKL